MSYPVQRLRPDHRPLLARHFEILDPDAARLRFGNSLSKDARRDYVRHVDFGRDAVFAVFDDDCNIIGVAHLARLEASAEVGLSVLKRHRGRGVGRALLVRAATHARSLGLGEIQLLCLPHNRAMAQLAASLGMSLQSVDGITQASAVLPAPSALTWCEEWVADEWARIDWVIKHEARVLKAGFRRVATPGRGIAQRLSRALAASAVPDAENAGSQTATELR